MNRGQPTLTVTVVPDSGTFRLQTWANFLAFLEFAPRRAPGIMLKARRALRKPLSLLRWRPLIKYPEPMSWLG